MRIARRRGRERAVAGAEDSHQHKPIRHLRWFPVVKRGRLVYTHTHTPPPPPPSRVTLDGDRDGAQLITRAQALSREHLYLHLTPSDTLSVQLLGGPKALHASTLLHQAARRCPCR